METFGVIPESAGMERERVLNSILASSWKYIAGDRKPPGMERHLEEAQLERSCMKLADRGWEVRVSRVVICSAAEDEQ